MTRDVYVSITGIDGSAKEDNIETIHCGQFYRKNDKVYIKYEETVEGTGDKINTMIKVGSEEIEITNRGAVNSHMVFLQGKRITNSYESPYGILNMGVDTEYMSVQETESTYDIELKYNIEFEGRYANSRHVLINVREQGREIRLIEE